MRRVLTVGLTYTGDEIEGVEIENLGLCQPDVDRERAAYPLYEYDTIIINPESYTHFLFGAAGEFSNELYELGKLKGANDRYDLDSAFDSEDRRKEMEAAIANGATVVWCLSEPKRVNFFGYRETHLGYVAPKVASFVKRSELLVKKGRRMGAIDPDNHFARYFEVLSRTGGWTLCLSDPSEGYASIAATPEGYSLGGQVTLPTSPTINPIANGMRVLLTKSGSTTLLDVDVAGGAYVSATKTGWRANPTGTRWSSR